MKIKIEMSKKLKKHKEKKRSSSVRHGAGDETV